MKKFKFQLETLLRVTRRKKDDAERDFAAAARKVEEAREGLNTLMEEMQKGQRDYDALAQEGVRVTVGRLMAFNSFFAWKREQIEMQQGILLQMKAEKQKKLQALMEVMSYLKSIEQLKERRWQEYQAEALQEEQKMLDEIGLQLTMRHKRREVEAK
ncbi:MAG: flagellar export protein FliJ [Selenomonas sp.]|jgi:flagellar FliJ protein|uniref:flagellar export protein FliJ n=1 Tax=Selenomonas sp. AE3005 TaxID=1485543 RepID=UPI000489D308|nr:flagellar export protein FliJ [Selenomonas sp. AE3005]MBQ1415908.1 flagellar export protein FliJ [Selenomonas sp.]MBQ1462413.1 flagellar export protein FliJ [Selenomonas sp.]MBQ1613179.1 flagellar export protein FliJ [Selenomonas sp.]MBQ1920011.1 flagellar export protein FliJ [Selenomonas sp.]MBQ2087086.1 flagellar export protein FliJ [Selenomonas sp.]